MADFPYILSPKSIRPFLNHIQGAGVPPKVTLKYLEATGFKNKSDRALISVLKFIGFIDNAGAPTELWKKFRSKANGADVLASALKSAYGSLFETYPDACDRPNNVIRDFISSHSDSGGRALDAMVGTFKALSSAANFSAVKKLDQDSGEEDELPDEEDEQEVKRKQRNLTGKSGVHVIVNVQLVVPATDDPAIYDSFFDAMKRHLIQSDE